MITKYGKAYYSLHGLHSLLCEMEKKGYQRRKIKRENQQDKTIEVTWSESKSEIERREIF